MIKYFLGLVPLKILSMKYGGLVGVGVGGWDSETKRSFNFYGIDLDIFLKFQTVMKRLVCAKTHNVALVYCWK